MINAYELIPQGRGYTRSMLFVALRPGQIIVYHHDRRSGVRPIGDAVNLTEVKLCMLRNFLDGDLEGAD